MHRNGITVIYIALQLSYDAWFLSIEFRFNPTSILPNTIELRVGDTFEFALKTLDILFLLLSDEEGYFKVAARFQNPELFFVSAQRLRPTAVFILYRLYGCSTVFHHRVYRPSFYSTSCNPYKLASR